MRGRSAALRIGGMQDTISLEGMVFYGYHGATEEERRLGQRFTVDVEMVTDTRKAGKSDRLEDTLDYGDAFKAVKSVMEGPSRRLIEALAEGVAEALFAALPLQTVRVRVEKPGAPIKGSVLAQTAVEIYRERTAS